MAARPIAASTISFGLVSLPVKLYATAVSKSRIAFNMVHKTCGTRVKQQYICPKGRRDRPSRGHREGLRIRQGPVRPVHH